MVCCLSKELKEVNERTVRLSGGREFPAEQATSEKGPELRMCPKCPRNTTVS